MSAFSIATGRGPLKPPPASLNPVRPTLSDQLLTTFGALVKWLPAEVVAGYTATVLIMQPVVDPSHPEIPLRPNISWTAWIICLIASPVLVLLLALASKTTQLMWRKTLLAIPAFVFWSAGVPYSVWNLWPTFASSKPLLLLALLLVTTAFSLLARWAVPDE